MKKLIVDYDKLKKELYEFLISTNNDYFFDDYFALFHIRKTKLYLNEQGEKPFVLITNLESQFAKHLKHHVFNLLDVFLGIVDGKVNIAFHEIKTLKLKTYLTSKYRFQVEGDLYFKFEK